MSNFDIQKMEMELSNFIPEYQNRAGLFLCLDGSGEMLINNQLYPIRRGTLYIISPLVMIFRVPQHRDFEGIHILDEQDVVYPVIHSIIDTIIHLKLRHSPCLQLEESDISFIISQKQRIDEKRRLLQSGVTDEARRLYSQMVRLIVQETILEVIAIYFRNSLVQSIPIDKGEAIIYHFIYELHLHSASQRSVAYYAEQAHLSPNYFSAIVKQQTGRTPSEWIVAMTIVNAKLLLTSSTKNIKEIATQLNFPEQYTFGKYFKQYTGLSPKAYRLKYKENREEN